MALLARRYHRDANRSARQGSRPFPVVLIPPGIVVAREPVANFHDAEHPAHGDVVERPPSPDHRDAVSAAPACAAFDVAPMFRPCPCWPIVM